MGDDGAGNRAGDGMVDHFAGRQATFATKGFPDTIKDHDGFVDRVAQDRQDRR